MPIVSSSPPSSLPPSGAASGDLAGTYPAPTFDLTKAHVYTGNQTAPALVASGLTGSVAASRYVGGVATVAPTTGAHSVGDFVIAQNGGVFVCTAAGTPGTWASVGGSVPPVTLDTGSGTDQALELTGTRTSNHQVFGIDYPHQVVDITSDGIVDIRSDDNMAVNFQGDSDSGANLTVQNQPTGQKVAINVKNGNNPLIDGNNQGDGKSLLRLTGGAVFEVQEDGTPRLNAHASPADGALSAGECALWFDQTNGAAKLMIKAKQANGTVVTGSVNLT